MPQYLVYIPAYFYLAGIVYRQSYGIWKNYGLVPQKTGAYFRQGITVFLLYTGGILAESSESLDRRKSYKGPEIFLRKISTISSDGFHKICDIWWFVPESVEIVRFYDEKLFDFM